MAAEIQDYSFEYPGEGEIIRQAYRVHYPGLTIRIHGRTASCPVIDLSPLGLAFRDEEQSCTLGQQVRFDLYVHEKICVEGVSAKVVRIRDKNLTGCVFEELSRLQERLLDKLTLEIQKRLIDQRKRKQQQEGNETEPVTT